MNKFDELYESVMEEAKDEDLELLLDILDDQGEFKVRKAQDFYIISSPRVKLSKVAWEGVLYDLDSGFAKNTGGSVVANGNISTGSYIQVKIK